jgi:hypothetical protein
LTVILLLALAGSIGAAMEKKFSYGANVTLAASNRFRNLGDYGDYDECHISGARSNGGERSTLLMWNISSLPRNSRITRATIELWIKNNSDDTFYVYGLRKRWTENEATWLKASKSTPWSKAGASGYLDRDEDLAGYIREPSTGLVRINLDTDLVQKWLYNSQKNYGVIITAASAFDDDDLSFDCSETSQSTLRPGLVIEFVR